MATFKSVYFCESDPKVWFEKRDDAERFDKVAEVSRYIAGAHFVAPTPMVDIVGYIMERYNIEQRYDWAEPAKDDQDETTTT